MQFRERNQAVPATALGFVEGDIGQPDELDGGPGVGPVHVGGADRQAEGDGQVTPGLITPALQVQAVDRLPELLPDLPPSGLPGVRQQDAELLPAIPADHVDLSQRAPEVRGDRPERLVPAQVAHPIVVLFEVIHIDHQQAERMAEPVGPGELQDQALFQGPAVAELGEGIGERARQGLFVLGCIVPGDLGELSEQQEAIPEILGQNRVIGEVD